MGKYPKISSPPGASCPGGQDKLVHQLESYPISSLGAFGSGKLKLLVAELELDPSVRLHSGRFDELELDPSLGLLVD